MELRSHFTLAIVVTYLILLITFIVCERKHYKEMLDIYDDKNCPPSVNCINFCPTSGKYSDNTLRKGLKNIPTYNSDFFGYHTNETILIIRNELICDDFELKVISEDLKGVEMSFGSYVEFNEVHHHYIYYCFDAYEKSEEIRFNGYFCEANRPLLYALSFLFVIITCFLLIIPLVIYLMIDEFKSSLHGRLCITLLVLQIFMVVFYPLLDIGEYFHDTLGIVIFIIMSILAYSFNICVTIMIFDIFISLRNFNDPDFQRQPYWKIFTKIIGVIYIVAIASILIFSKPNYLIFLQAFLATILMSFVLLLVIDGVLLIMTYISIVKLGKTPETTENTRFNIEQKRFFLYVRFFVIFSIMWAVEFIAETMFSYTANIVASIIKVMSAAIIAQSLLVNPTVRALFVKKYISLNNNIEDANTVLM